MNMVDTVTYERMVGYKDNVGVRLQLAFQWDDPWTASLFKILLHADKLYNNFYFFTVRKSVDKKISICL